MHSAEMSIYLFLSQLFPSNKSSSKLTNFSSLRGENLMISNSAIFKKILNYKNTYMCSHLLLEKILF